MQATTYIVANLFIESEEDDKTNYRIDEITTQLCRKSTS